LHNPPQQLVYQFPVRHHHPKARRSAPLVGRTLVSGPSGRRRPTDLSQRISAALCDSLDYVQVSRDRDVTLVLRLAEASMGRAVAYTLGPRHLARLEATSLAPTFAQGSHVSAAGERPVHGLRAPVRNSTMRRHAYSRRPRFSVPPASRKTAEGKEADQDDDQPDPKAPDDHQDNPDDDNDPSRRYPGDSSSILPL
jgi:hypothetical protein